MSATDPVIEAARLGAPDRYIAALYADADARSKLLALAAFEADLARIAQLLREPMLVDIRLQWWRDALASGIRGKASGQLIVDQLSPDVASGQLPVGLLYGMIDAASGQPRTDVDDAQSLKSHLSKSEGAAFLLAARACGAQTSPDVEAAAHHAGLCYGLARRLAAAVAQPADNGQTARCRQTFAEAAAAVARLDSALMPAFLPLAMVPVYLKQANSRPVLGGLPLQRWCRMFQAVLTGRIA